MNLKISVIVPIYNVQKYLAECLNSIIIQNYKNFEVIMINDGSTDKSEKIARKYLKDTRFKLINQKKNSGLSVARNTGIMHVSGNILYYCDSDDVLPQNLFNIIQKQFQDKDIDLVSFNTTCLRSNIKNITTRLISYRDFNQQDSLRLLMDHSIEQAPWSYACRANIILENQDIRFPKDRYFEDIIYTPLMMIHIKKMRVLNLKKGGYLYRADRPNSITNGQGEQKLKKKIKDKLFLFQKKGEILQNKVDNPSYVHYWHLKELLNLYHEYYLEGYKTQQFLFLQMEDSIMQLTSKYPIISRKLALKEKIQLYLLKNKKGRNLYYFYGKSSNYLKIQIKKIVKRHV